MANTNKTGNRYTYSNFATDVLSLLNGEKSMGDLPIKDMTAKAEALLAAQATKAAYNASHPRKSAAKGPGSDTKERAAQIAINEPRVWDDSAPDPQHRIAAKIKGDSQ